jgi:hypothetical protein
MLTSTAPFWLKLKRIIARHLSELVKAIFNSEKQIDDSSARPVIDNVYDLLDNKKKTGLSLWCVASQVV